MTEILNFFDPEISIGQFLHAADMALIKYNKEIAKINERKNVYKHFFSALTLHPKGLYKLKNQLPRKVN